MCKSRALSGVVLDSNRICLSRRGDGVDDGGVDEDDASDAVCDVWVQVHGAQVRAREVQALHGGGDDGAVPEGILASPALHWNIPFHLRGGGDDGDDTLPTFTVKILQSGDLGRTKKKVEIRLF